MQELPAALRRQLGQNDELGHVAYAGRDAPIVSRKTSMLMAGKVLISTVPREPSSTEMRAITSLLGASTTLTKSYGPRMAYWAVTRPPMASISLFTSDS